MEIGVIVDKSDAFITHDREFKPILDFAVLERLKREEKLEGAEKEIKRLIKNRSLNQETINKLKEMGII